MKAGSLFSGIGGGDLGLERAGFRVAWQVEQNEYCRRVLAKHWPDVPKYIDVRDAGKHNLEWVHLIHGGVPCQPASVAGKRRGQDDNRWLWPEFIRIVGEIRPEWVLAENPPGILSIDAGRGFGEILAGLARCGYDATWASIPAAATGAPHLRYRVFIVAYRDGERIQGFWKGQIPRFENFSWCENVRRAEDLRGRSDIPEPLVWRTGNGVPHRVDRLRGLGNAEVPQVVEWLGKRIVALEAQP